ncbi:recombination protein RecT [Oceanisphaera litoralis]|uniref:recombinase RecT n=1 Tax=Oceanisphaera litoralis TaxID=225144 RepID=UPI001959B54B|nr:recombinase RecT [Oceanisphaera litoralis]MBM7455210.1 recombination protein RecT [Oceanisphaera litoralis]
MGTQVAAGTVGAFYEMMAPEIEKQGIYSLLPAHITPEAFVRAAAVAMAKSPDLAEADPNTVIMALSDCAKDGLVPDNREAALVVYNSKVKRNGRDEWIKKAQYLPMVDGVLKRARQSGQIDVIAGKAVFEGDEFDYWMDENGEHINYRPKFVGRGEFILSFAFAKLKTGELIVEVMTKEEVDRVRKASKGGQYGPWADWYDRMAVKSALHRLARRLPNASELMDMLERGQPMDFHKEKDVTPAPPPVAAIDHLKAAIDGKPAPEQPQSVWSDEQEDRYQEVVDQMGMAQSQGELSAAGNSLATLGDLPEGYRDTAMKAYREKKALLDAMLKTEGVE